MAALFALSAPPVGCFQSREQLIPSRARPCRYIRPGPFRWSDRPQSARHARHRRRQSQGGKRQEHARHAPRRAFRERRRRGDARRRRPPAIDAVVAALAQPPRPAAQRADRRLGGRPKRVLRPPAGVRHVVLDTPGWPARLRPGARRRIRRRHPDAGLQFDLRPRVRRRLLRRDDGAAARRERPLQGRRDRHAPRRAHARAPRCSRPGRAD